MWRVAKTPLPWTAEVSTQMAWVISMTVKESQQGKACTLAQPNAQNARHHFKPVDRPSHRQPDKPIYHF
jgi:hypothetical protein